MSQPVSRRVLVLDDDVMMCQFLEQSLSRRGFEVVSETSPQQALDRIALEDFDVVVSDLNMEGLDGLAFTHRVLELRQGLPVILITGSATMETAIEAVRTGAWDFLAKPIDPKRLVVSMDRACEHSSLSRELRLLREQVGSTDSCGGLPRA